MTLTINESHKNVNRIRITYCNGVVNILWPLGTDIEFKTSESSASRKEKIHESIIRCVEHDDDFKETGLHLKTNMQISRLDKFEYIDLRWTATELGDEE